MGGGSSDRSGENDEQLAQEQGRALVAGFALPELFHETAFLPRASLSALIAALAAESTLPPSLTAEPAGEGEDKPSSGEGKGEAAMAVHLLAEVGLRNRDRFGLIWSELEPAFRAALKCGQPQV